MTKKQIVSGIALALALAACSSLEVTSPEPEDQGEYEALVTGENITIELSGSAIFGVQAVSGEWVIFLWSGQIYGNSFNVTTLFRENPMRPEVGTYTIYDVDDGTPTVDDFLAGYVFAQTGSLGAFYSLTGTLTITESSGGEVSGTFEFTGEADPNNINVTAPTATVTGSFRAVLGIIPT